MPETLVEGTTFIWRLESKTVLWPVRCWELTVVDKSKERIPLRCTFNRFRRSSGIGEDTIGAIIQFALMSGWESDAGTPSHIAPMARILAKFKRRRCPQRALIDPFHDPPEHFEFPTQINDFFSCKVRRISNRDPHCRCKLCCYEIHNNRCPECGDLMRTSKGRICSSRHTKP